MTDVINEIPTEENNVYLNEIRQSAKKYNWLERTEKNNCYVFSKDNVKINIIGLKGFATIEIKLLNGVFYKMCRCNMKKEDIIDLFANTNYNSNNDFLNKTILCNYNLTVKEKIELFNKNDRSFLKNVKYKDLDNRDNNNLYKTSSELKTKIKNNISTNKSGVEFKKDYTYLYDEKKNKVDVPVKIQVGEIVSPNLKEMNHLSDTSNKDVVHTNDNIVCQGNEIQISSFLNEANFYENKEENIIERKKKRNEKKLKHYFYSKKEFRENKNGSCEYIKKKKTYLREKRDTCDKYFINEREENEIDNNRKNNDIDINVKHILNKEKKKEECDENIKKEKDENIEEKSKEKIEKEYENENDNKNENEQQKQEINQEENIEEKKEQQQQLKKDQSYYPNNTQEECEELIYSYESNPSEKKINKIENMKIYNTYDKNIFDKRKNTKKKHYKTFPNNYYDKKNIRNNTSNLAILHNNNFNSFNNINEYVPNYRNIRDYKINAESNNIIYKNSYESNSFNVYTFSGCNIKNEIIQPIDANCNNILINEKFNEYNRVTYHNIYCKNYNNSYIMDYYNSYKNYDESFHMDYNNIYDANYMNNRNNMKYIGSNNNIMKYIDSNNNKNINKMGTTTDNIGNNNNNNISSGNNMNTSHISRNNNINCINRKNFNYNYENVIIDDKKMNSKETITYHNFHINNMNTVNSYFQNNYLNKYKKNYKEKYIKENSNCFMYNARNQNQLEIFNENKKALKNVYNHRNQNFRKNNYYSTFHMKLYGKNNFNVDKDLYLKKKNHYMNYNNYYYHITEDMINYSYFFNNINNNSNHLQLYNRGNKKRFHNNMNYGNFYECYRKKDNRYYNNSILCSNKNFLKKNDKNSFSKRSIFNKIQKSYKTNYIKKLYDKYNIDKTESTRLKIKKKKIRNNVEEEIYKKKLYLTHFKYDSTNSLPRYYCTIKHLLKENNKKRLHTWLKVMLTKQKCGYCNEKFDNLEKLENHLKQVSTHKVFYCCRKPFPSVKYLCIHLKRENHYGYIYNY